MNKITEVLFYTNIFGFTRVSIDRENQRYPKGYALTPARVDRLLKCLPSDKSYTKITHQGISVKYWIR